MSRPISWYRLFRGKVWHVGFAQDAAACGSERPADAETVGERAPVNARVCGDCASAVRHLYGLVLAAEAGDPRKPLDPWAAGEALIAAEDILCVTCGRPDHEGRLCAADDLVEWPCGSCGHPNLDHDYGDGSCMVADDAFDAAAGESLGPCECRGLTRAG